MRNLGKFSLFSKLIASIRGFFCWLKKPLGLSYLGFFLVGILITFWLSISAEDTKLKQQMLKPMARITALPHETVSAPHKKQAHVPSKPVAAPSPPPAKLEHRMTLIVGTLGLNAQLTEQAIKMLPAATVLVMSPFSEALDKWIHMAHQKGHQTLIEIPCHHPDKLNNDPGPHAISQSFSVETNIERLHWALTQGFECQGAFFPLRNTLKTSPQHYRPLIQSIDKKDFVLIDPTATPQSGIKKHAEKSLITYKAPDRFLSTQSLIKLSKHQKYPEVKKPSEIIYAQLYPITATAITAWEKHLKLNKADFVPLTLEKHKKQVKYIPVIKAAEPKKAASSGH